MINITSWVDYHIIDFRQISNVVKTHVSNFFLILTNTLHKTYLSQRKRQVVWGKLHRHGKVSPINRQPSRRNRRAVFSERHYDELRFVRVEGGEARDVRRPKLVQISLDRYDNLYV